jgi:hypothetical protein
MTAYSTNIGAYHVFEHQLRELDDGSIFDMWQHVLAENFHPDVEFSHFALEGKISADEFMDVLTEEVDRRMKQTRLEVPVG